MKALLVDDERLARAALRRMLKSHQDMDVIGEARNAGEAEAQIRQLQPDVVFLDVEMPGISGLQLLEKMNAIPPVIFTTAYQDYAVRAFEVNALDYLVKPITQDRLATALERLRNSIVHRRASSPDSRQLFLRERERCWIVALDRIDVLESEGNYTRIYFEDHRPLIYSSLNALESRLDPTLFFRASRSHIVNLRKIASVTPRPDGSLIATLNATVNGGLTINISRRRSRILRTLLTL